MTKNYLIGDSREGLNVFGMVDVSIFSKLKFLLDLRHVCLVVFPVLHS